MACRIDPGDRAVVTAVNDGAIKVGDLTCGKDMRRASLHGLRINLDAAGALQLYSQRTQIQALKLRVTHVRSKNGIDAQNVFVIGAIHVVDTKALIILINGGGKAL